MIAREKISFNTTNYEILLTENFSELGEEILKLEKFSKLFILSEKKVTDLYYEEVSNELDKHQINHDLILMKGTEKNKSIKNVRQTYNELIKKNADRKSIILALGGGVVGDYTGFIAATFLRGIRFVQVPTTLLAMVDSSVGGKVAVNADFGKNMIGSFHQPSLVYQGIHTLKTLKPKEWKCGLAEILKHSLLKGENFFQEIKSFKYESIHDLKSLKFMILESIKYKTEIVSKDEKETGLRGVLNLGHTLGHAIESATKYKKYSHGEAVAMGLLFAIILSIKKKNLPEKFLSEFIKIMKNFKLRRIDKSLKINELIEHMYHDKKTSEKKLKFILLDEIGKASFGNEILESEILLAFEIYSKIA